MAEAPDLTKRKRHDGSGRSKSGCLTCRIKKVKCDENVPSCGRCDRLKLTCQQPSSRILPSLRERRRDVGSWRSRDHSSWAPQSLSPSSPQLQMPEQQDQGQLLWRSSPTMAGTGFCNTQNSCSMYSGQRDSGVGQFSSFEDEGNVWLDLGTNFSLSNHAQESLPLPPHRPSTQCELQSIVLPSISIIEDELPTSGIIMTTEEEDALRHYRTTFSLSQTTRDPEWSIPNMLVQHALKNSDMLLRLILAVALYDLPSDAGDARERHRLALKHYEAGTRQLTQALQKEIVLDHFEILGSLYCIYAYFFLQRRITLLKIDRLSLTCLEHLRKHNLSATATTPTTLTSTSQHPITASMRVNRSLVARLVMWLIKIDSFASFFGSKASLSEFYQSQPALLEEVQADSRLALQLGWGVIYPISQSIRDIESCTSVNMMTELLMLFPQIGTVAKSSLDKTNSPLISVINAKLSHLEVKYSAVLYYGSSSMTLQPAMKLNCASSATLLYALRIYFLRCEAGSAFGAPDSPEASQALGQLLFYARHVCLVDAPQLVWEFQWSLFIASIETNDMIYQEWLQSRIFNPRFIVSLQRLAVIKESITGSMTLETVQQSLL